MNIIETVNGIEINDTCLLCKHDIVKDPVKRIMSGPVDIYCEDDQYHHHDIGVYEGKWYCEAGHSGIYYQHRLCSVKDCDYSKI